MSFVVRDRVKETSTTTGTGTLTLAGAVSGFQAFSVVGNGNLCKYTLLAGSESAPTAWERGYGTWATGGTLARTLVLDNSSGTTSPITLAAGTHTVMLGWGADDARDTEVAQHAATPGGRLTLTSGTPVTTSDVTGATSIYYTPYVSNVITLWDGYRWHPIEFSEYTLALGTLSSGKPYDVFAYLSSGALACEVLVWTNDTTRATAITIQDGRYCKSGDKTRLYLGTFYTTATTTTEDSEGGTTTQVGGKRYLWNMYNRVRRSLRVVDTADSWTYSTASWRRADGASAGSNEVAYVTGLNTDAVRATLNAGAYSKSIVSATYSGIGVDSGTAPSGLTAEAFTESNAVGITALHTAHFVGMPGVGRHFLAWLEKGNANGPTFIGDDGASDLRNGLIAEVFA